MLFLADEILHAFESNGNLHFILGVSSGQLDDNGLDIKNPVVTLVIPSLKAGTISGDFQSALETLVKKQPNSPNQEKNNLTNPEEFLGVGVRISKS